MSDSVYPIQRWDAVLLPRSTHSQPALYVLADDYLKDLVQHSLQTSNEISVKITNTDSIYDNSIAYATIQPSSITAGYRPNFQARTDWLVIVPKMNWQSYPPRMGAVEILGVDMSTTSSSSTGQSENFVLSSDLHSRYRYHPQPMHRRLCIQNACCLVLDTLLLFFILRFFLSILQYRKET